ncbi:MAG: sigma-70 family RNA polymerase sigma factor [Candidatus Gastranaerophilaceae bacterium]
MDSSLESKKQIKFNLKEYTNLIETVSKVEFSKVSSYGLIEYPEIVNMATHTVYIILNNKNPNLYNNAYLTQAIKWAIRNEVRRRYKWYTLKNNQPVDNSEIREVVYKSILSVEEMADAENPVIIKDNSQTPEEKAEFMELKNRIVNAIQHLPERERALVEAKFFQDKKLKDIAIEFNISQSRISRIIQNALDKVRRELIKQEEKCI